MASLTPNSSALEAAPAETREEKAREPAIKGQSVSWCFLARRLLKVAGLTFLVLTFLVALVGHPAAWIDSERFKANLMSILFLVGLILVVLEDHVGVNKSAIMLIVSASMWTFLSVGYHSRQSKEGHDALEHELNHGLQDVGSIILFLLPAMGVVESIDHFRGFSVVTHCIQKATGGNKERLMPVLCLLTFFMSAIIDSLTATIVSLKLSRHAVGEDRHLRHAIGGLVVIAANAGGAWSPVGDVTTTMLWLQDKISVGSIITWLFVPSFVSCIFPMAGIWWDVRRHMRKNAALVESQAQSDEPSVEDSGAIGAGEEGDSEGTGLQRRGVHRSEVAVLSLGVTCILMVPVLKMTTGLPPYLGMLLALGIIWLVTDTVWFRNFRNSPKLEGDEESGAGGDDSTPQTPAASVEEGEGVVEALHKMDLTGLLFFAGVLLAVGALDTAGVLEEYAELLVKLCGHSPVAICTLLGISSAFVDNVPLVQASINMFGADTPMDDPLWQLVALAAGTGGSVLSVGSIAGVTLMTMEGVGYLWYCRKISLWALIGFALGIGTYQLERFLFA